MQQHIFQDGLLGFYLVEINESGKVTLKIKEKGWSDIWSLPVEEVTKDYS